MSSKINHEKCRTLSGLNSETKITLNGEISVCHARDLQPKKVLGQGSYGIVFEMEHKRTRQIMAVKKIKFINTEPERLKLLNRDVEISMTVNSQFTVKFYGALFHEGDVWILMEKMDLSLDKFYLQAIKQEETIPEQFIAKITLPVVKGLHYLKTELKIIHRDVKPSNILLNSNGEIRLCDFGISGPLIDSVAMTKNAGCKAYMAPERIDPSQSGKEYDTRSDIWSLGISLIEVSTGQYPYKTFKSPFDHIKEIVEGDPPKLPYGWFSATFEDFLQKCLVKDVKQRSKYDDLLKHPFLMNAETQCFNVEAYVTPIIANYKSQM